MCGGAGRRLWPLSRPDRPKPLLPLGDVPLLTATIERFSGEGFSAPWLVAGLAHAEAMGRLAPQAELIAVERDPRGTAAAIAAIALVSVERSPGSLLLITPADQLVLEPASLREAAARASGAARDGRIVVFGITPDHPATGYGWISPGEPVDEGVLGVERFIEKPERSLAERLFREGRCLWNAGIFLMRDDTAVETLERLAPDLLCAVREAICESERPDRVMLSGEALRSSAPVSFDVAVMERTERAAVAPVSCGWSDVGSWRSVRAAGLGRGPAHLSASPGSFAYSDGPRIAVIGVPDVIVVASGGAVLVSSPDQVDRCGELEPATDVILDRGEGYEIRRLSLSPGEPLAIAEGCAAMLVEGSLGGAAPGAMLRPGSYVASEGATLVITTFGSAAR